MAAYLVLAAALMLALAYGAVWADAPPSLSKSLCKTLSVAFLAPAAAVLGAPGLIVAGLALGAMGDLCLSRPGQGAFLAGMGAFGLGHLAYALHFWGTGGPLSLLWLAGLGALALSTEVWLAPRTGTLRWPVRAYVGIIALMALAASTLGLTLTAAGAFFFLLSDLLLSLDLFVLPANAARPALRRTLWAAYWGGQSLILLGMVPPNIA